MAAPEATTPDRHRDSIRLPWLFCLALSMLMLVALALGLRSDWPIHQRQPPSEKPPVSAADLDDWVGVYSSPEEIGVFSGTVLVIEKDDELHYRKRFYSDVVSANDIKQDVRTGGCLADGDRLFIPEAYGYYRDGKPQLLASVERFTRASINGRIVLLRDDAREAYESEDKLYDYGILIKIADKADLMLDLDEVKHESIKLLYTDKTKGWKDPFVHGPNER
jgi:hypothetical protein